MKKLMFKYAATLSSMALFIALAANGARSTWIYHQPQVPANLEKYRK